MAITILAAGALLTLPALQRSSDYLRYLYQRRDAEIAINNLFVQAEIRFKADRSLHKFPLEGETAVGDTRFTYRIQLQPVNAGEALMEVQATVNWLGEGTSGLTRSAYVAN